MRSNEQPPADVDPALIAGLASRAGELATIANDLVATVRISRLTRFFIISGMIVLLGGMAANVWNTFATKRSASLIVSCTDPNGKCYQDSRKDTGQSVQNINDTVIAAVACSKVPTNETTADIRNCVLATLSHK